MSKSVIKRKLISYLTGAVMTIALVFALLGGSVQTWAQTNDGNMGTAEGSLSTADSNNSSDLGGNGDADTGGDDVGEGDDVGDADADNAGESDGTGDADADNAGESDGTGDANADDDDAGESGDTVDANADDDDAGESGDAENLDETDDALESIQEASHSIKGLVLLSVPYLYFGEIEFSSAPQTLQASIQDGVAVSDMSGEGWHLSVRYKNIDNKLPGRLFFRQGDVEVDITEDSQIIYSHPSRDPDEAETTVTKKWNNRDEGFWLEVNSDDIADYDLSEMISAALIWEITPVIQ